MKILIVEDERPAAQRLEKMILAIDPNFKIVGVTDSVESTLNWLETHDLPQLIMMDIQLADDTCFEIFNLKTIDCPVIFTTAYDDHAIKAFKVNAIDYLLKPLSKVDLERALLKYKNLYPTIPVPDYNNLQLAIPTKSVHRFLVKQGARFRVVELHEVAYFYSELKMTFLVQPDGRTSVIEFTLEKLELLLPPKDFFRINRQFLLSISSIADLISYSKSRLKVNLIPPAKTECIVSSEKASEFKRWLSGD